MPDTDEDDWGTSKDSIPAKHIALLKHKRFLKYSQMAVLLGLGIFVLALLLELGGNVDNLTKILAVILPIVSFVIGRDSSKDDG